MRRLFVFLLMVLIGVGGFFFYKKYFSPSTKTPGTNTADFKPFFPTGETPSENPDGGLFEPPAAPATGAVIKSNLSQISIRPVAGYSTFSETYRVPVIPTDPKQKPTTKEVTDQVVRYISRASGYVYEKRNDDQPIQVSNIYIPNIYEGFLSKNNTLATLRFLRDDEETIATYTLPIPPKNTDGTRTQKPGSFLPDNLSQFFVSPDQAEVGRLYKEGGQTILLTTDTAGAARKEVLRTPFHEWIVFWPTKNTLYLQTKAAATAEGFLYRIDRTERKLRRVLGNVLGLTTSVSPSGTYVLYSESTGNTFVSSILNTKTNTTTRLNLKVLPEKCIWKENEDLLCAGESSVTPGVYPDGWYAGVLHFSDKVFAISTKYNTFDTVFDGSEKSFDLTMLSFSAATNALYFIDKPSGLLWKLDLGN